MEKVIKFKSYLSKQDITLTISEELNKLKGKVLAPRKLEDANRILRELKTPLPKK
jgi:hypothetical protein